MRGKFITFEGPDGAGKTTQVALTADALRGAGYHVRVTREPGGTRLSESIRGLLLDPSFREMTPAAEALLYASARAQLVQEVILPALASGSIVLCDRFVDSSLAYQGSGRGLDPEVLKAINALALNDIGAFLTILLDLEPDQGLRRAERHKQSDRLEQEDPTFHRRVRDGYLLLAGAHPDRIKVVRAEGDPGAVQTRVWAYVSDFVEGRLQGGQISPK